VNYNLPYAVSRSHRGGAAPRFLQLRRQTTWMVSTMLRPLYLPENGSVTSGYLRYLLVEFGTGLDGWGKSLPRQVSNPVPSTP